jgi:hypothetical protein
MGPPTSEAAQMGHQATPEQQQELLNAYRMGGGNIKMPLREELRVKFGWTEKRIRNWGYEQHRQEVEDGAKVKTPGKTTVTASSTPISAPRQPVEKPGRGEPGFLKHYRRCLICNKWFSDGKQVEKHKLLSHPQEDGHQIKDTNA